ncbi:MAG TPA: hypothetical protein VGX23_13720 [Actinocrinis sp.]|nr:hypothetical protein [Actinocrinis sp.]
MHSRRAQTVAIATVAAVALFLTAFVTYHFARSPQTISTVGLGSTASSGPSGDPGSSVDPTSSVGTLDSVPLSTTAPANLPLPAGGSLSVPQRAVAGHGTLVAQTVVAPAPPPSGALLVGNTYNIVVNNTQLTNNITLNLPAPSYGPAGPDEAIIAYYDLSAHAWTPVATSYDHTTHMAVAIGNHATDWCVFRVDSASLTNWLHGTFSSFLSADGTVAQPVCAGSADAAALGVSVDSSAESLVKWCVGESGGQIVLTVANSRGFAVAFDYPQGWSPQAGAWSDLDTAVTDGLSGLRTAVPAGDQVAIIPGGESLTFTFPANAAGNAQATPSPAAFLTSAFIYGVNTLVQATERTPFASAPRSGAALAAVQAALRDQECLSSAQGILDDSVTDVDSARSAFWQGLNLAGTCLGKVWAGVDGESAATASYVSGVYSWLVGSLQPYGQSLGAELDSSLYWQGDNLGVNNQAGSASAGAPTDQASPATPTAPSTVTAPPSTSTAGPTTQGPPVLGAITANSQQGYGQVEPSRIFNGGDPQGLVTGVSWSSWGGSTATGTGMSDWVSGNESVAEGTQEQVTVVAFDLGTCNGTLMYQKLEWYFPENGQSFDVSSGTPISTCN